MVSGVLAPRPLADGGFSLYLDLCRFLAALAVLLGHMSQDGYAIPSIFERLSHEAVIVFFVISGLVIAHSAEGRDARVYAAARFSRLYAVIIPAMLFSILCAAFITSSGWQPGVADRGEWSFADLGLSLMFLSRSWLVDANLPLNYPFWSLCYEAFYYLIFALLLYGGRLRWLWAGIAALIAGPAILALMPAWLAGVWLHHRGGRLRKHSRFVAAVALIAILAICLSGLPDIVRKAVQGEFPIWYVLRDSTPVLTDLPIAALFLIHLVAMRSAVPGILRKYARAIKILSAATFTIYMFHRPLIILLSGEQFEMLHGPVGSIILLLGLVAGGMGLSQILEGRFTAWLRGHLALVLQAPPRPVRI
ncbi:acyltransferase [Pacificimonas sp. WHA3]|uniref:Acyltransferase n=1 Tax=Pacificimonas pallii TaxID=2827236 RepID=A0ABS6SD06_9SPHN|nr:acyltransferase [Pacificimonas pallii]MBV7255806.1 acyltransferase [Pacificimonas pallii]